MAELQNVPSGWEKDGNNGYYSARFGQVTKGTSVPNANPAIANQTYAYSVNPTTGDRIVYAESGTLFSGRQPIMSIDSSGKVTELSGYSKVKENVGDTGLKTLQDSSRSAASSFMNQTGTTAAVKDSKEFKSSLGNAGTLNKDGSTTESGSSGGDASTASLDRLSDIGGTIGDAAGKVRQSYPKNLKYPSNLDTAKQDYVKINMYRYVPTPLSASSISTGGGLNRSGRTDSKRSSIGQCILPIQGQVSDTNTVDWSSANLSPIQAMAAAASYSTIIAGGQGADLAAEGMSKMIKDNKGDVQKFLATYFAGEAASAQNLLSRTSGAVVNPNMELLFNGPQLRQFTLAFRMTPRDRADVDNVRKIIRFFKQGMSVKQSSSELFLKSPNTFQVQYINSGKDHPYIGRTKECALLNCTVNYVPEGTYMTFAEVPSMTAYDMQLTFTELTPLYDGDYPNDNDASIGY